MITIIDYGMGNLRSIRSKLSMVDIDSIVSSEIEDMENADKFILPGVGNFAKGMENLRELDLVDVLNRRVVKDGVPILGICLGMQLLTKRSEEGNAIGLGWIDAETRRFDFTGLENKLRIPHVGWNTLDVKKGECLLLKDVPENYRFYFTHSFHVCSEREEDIVATTQYGYDFVSAVERKNVFGTQFHPEKSHVDGLQIIKNFVRHA